MNSLWAGFGIALAPGSLHGPEGADHSYLDGGEKMDGLLLQTVEGLGEPPPPSGCEVWERLQSEKERVARELISERACRNPVCGMQLSEAAEEYEGEIEWRRRIQLEARLSELSEAQDRLMDGSYGRCRDCRAVIDKRRLAADPAAALCIGCHTSSEPEVVFSAF